MQRICRVAQRRGEKLVFLHCLGASHRKDREGTYYIWPMDEEVVRSYSDGDSPTPTRQCRRRKLPALASRRKT